MMKQKKVENKKKTKLTLYPVIPYCTYYYMNKSKQTKQF